MKLEFFRHLDAACHRNRALSCAEFACDNLRNLLCSALDPQTASRLARIVIFSPVMHILEAQHLADLAIAERCFPLAHLARDFCVWRVLFEEFLQYTVSHQSQGPEAKLAGDNPPPLAPSS